MARNVLILGGTSWLGGALARGALDRGHQVTCLARGESGGVPERAEWVHADRREPGAYDAVAERRWDAVLDVGRQPEQVRSAVAALATQAEHWSYVSTSSVYADDSTPDQDESAALLAPWAGTGEAAAEDYGSAKVACEVACREAVPAEHLLVARAGLIVGYGDLSDRFGYWPARLARATERSRVLVPPRDAATQVLDVADLTAWLVDAAEEAIAGTFNATGDTVSLADILAECERAVGGNVACVEVDQAWLLEQEVEPWGGPESLPLWLPQPDYAGHATRSNLAAKRSGLRLRALCETVRDALAWERELGLHRSRRAGLSAEREADLLRMVT